MKRKTSNIINRYEFISLIRQKWIQSLLVVLVILLSFASINGFQRVEQRVADIQDAQATVQEKDALGVILLDSIEAGFSVDVPRWYMPDKPNVVGSNYLRVAAMPPGDLAVIATGQSDIYSHYVKPVLYGESFELNYTELSNPVQLMFGSFDISFVVIYLLPLIVIAFTYNIVSQEREEGTLQVVASQPISIFQWMLQKALIRYLLLAGILVTIILILLTIVGVPFIQNVGKLSMFLLIAVGYMLFWFVIACLVNLHGQSSANNAVVLIGWWILLVLLVPSSINQVASSFHPVPSRARLINELRVVNNEAEKKADELLANFLRDHPELAGFEGGSQGWKEYFATQDLIKSEIQPVLDEYESKLESQQDWVDRSRFISPALLIQNSFNELAGTSTRDYEDYRQQVADFSVVWRDFFLPMIFKGEDFTKDLMAQLPEFTYRESTTYKESITNTVAIFFYSLLLLILGLAWFMRKKTHLILT